MKPSEKTLRTLALMDVLQGVERVNLNPQLLAENLRIWRELTDTTPHSRVWDCQATLEWAIKQPETIFKPKPLQGWFVREVDRRVEYVVHAKVSRVLSTEQCRSSEVATLSSALRLREEKRQPLRLTRV